MNKFEWTSTHDGVLLSMVSSKESLMRSTKTSLPISDWASGGDNSVLIGLAAVTELLQDVSDLSATSIGISHSFVSR